MIRPKLRARGVQPVERAHVAALSGENGARRLVQRLLAAYAADGHVRCADMEQARIGAEAVTGLDHMPLEIVRERLAAPVPREPEDAHQRVSDRLRYPIDRPVLVPVRRHFEEEMRLAGGEARQSVEACEMDAAIAVELVELGGKRAMRGIS